MKTIGILALQGNFSQHQAFLSNLPCQSRLVTKPDHLPGLSGLIIPGGESSAMLRLMKPWDFINAIQTFYHQGGALMGTCAGLILMAKHVDPSQKSLALLDVTVQRNAYGRQVDSFVASGDWSEELSGKDEGPMVFIRAPAITSIGEDVRVLAHCQSQPVLVHAPRLLAATFHPEMSGSLRVHRYFTEHCLGSL
jgi:5'-phosphate synthase pdxT subunit